MPGKKPTKYVCNCFFQPALSEFDATTCFEQEVEKIFGGKSAAGAAALLDN